MVPISKKVHIFFPKKIFLALFFMIFLWANAPIQAAELVDPAHIIAKNQFSIGLEATYMSEMQYDDTTADATRHISDGTIETYQYAVTNLKLEDDQYYFLTLNYGVMDKLSLFAKAGLVTDGKKSSGSNPDQYYNLDNNFVGALGGKFKLLEYENGASLVLSGQYMRYDNRSQTRGWASAWNTDFEIDQWRIDAELIGAWKFDNLTPYAGVKYSYVNLDLSGSSTGVVSGLTRRTYSEYTSNNEKKWGLLVGLGWDITPAWRLVVQGDFIVDTAGSLSLIYHFPNP